MFSEEELLPLSALQHLIFCERQCALIHVEQVWSDNALTLEGSRLHRRTDEQGPRREVRGDLVILRALPLRSLSLGLSGKTDIVEFQRVPSCDGAQGQGQAEFMGTSLPGLVGTWRAFPVEYKRGRPKKGSADRVQLCAQALSLEEMLDVSIPDGALFYGRTQRRVEVIFDSELRAETRQAAQRLHELISTGVTPRARKEGKCERCSLVDICLPGPGSGARSARAFFTEALREAQLFGGWEV